MATYQIVEDDVNETGRFWVAKITKTRIILQVGSWGNLRKTCQEIGRLSELGEGRRVIYDRHPAKLFL